MQQRFSSAAAVPVRLRDRKKETKLFRQRLLVSRLAWQVLVFLVMSGLWLTAAAQARKQAVVVGIDAYPDSIGPLPSCIEDATAMRDELAQHQGFASLELLTDADATKAGIIQALRRGLNHLTAGDLFVFYYSGHGTLWADRKSEVQDETRWVAYPPDYPRDKYDAALVPVDADQPGKRWGRLLLDDELYEIFAPYMRQGIQIIVINDSCLNGTLAKGLDGVDKFINALELFGLDSFDQVPDADETKVAPRLNASRYLVLSSSRDDEVSSPYNPETNADNSLFTYFLLKNLRAARQQRRALTYRMVQQSVSQQVARAARDNGRQQTPQVDDRFFACSLDTPLFATPCGAVSTSPVRPSARPTGPRRGLRIMLQVRNPRKGPPPYCSVGIYDQYAELEGLQSTQAEALVLGETDSTGAFDSRWSIHRQTLEPGPYRIKIVCDGYAPLILPVTVSPSKTYDDIAVWDVELD